jgi:COP9 signalosome complex subunit 1
MDVEGEVPAAAAAAMANGLGGADEASPAPVSPEQLDVEAYAAQYSGRTRLARGVFVADRCGVEAIQLEALRMAYDEIKRGEDVQLDRDVAAKIGGRLGPRYGLDQAWVDTITRRADQRNEKLENELNGYRVRKPDPFILRRTTCCVMA